MSASDQVRHAALGVGRRSDEGVQLESVLRFFDSKRGVALSEVDASFDDVKSDGWVRLRPRLCVWNRRSRPKPRHRLEDAMYNRDDVESLLDTISASVHVRHRWLRAAVQQFTPLVPTTDRC